MYSAAPSGDKTEIVELHAAALENLERQKKEIQEGMNDGLTSHMAELISYPFCNRTDISRTKITTWISDALDRKLALKRN